MITWEPTPVNSAANGLVSMITREDWRASKGERICQLLRPLLDSPDDTVRMLASRALQLVVEPESLTDELCQRLEREENAMVIEALIATLAAHVTSDPDGIDACLKKLSALPRWSALSDGPEDKSISPGKRRSEVGDLLIQVLLYLTIRRDAPFASGLLATWQQHPEEHPAAIGRLVAWTRPYLNPSNEAVRAEQTRAFAMYLRLSEACVGIMTSIQQELGPGQQTEGVRRQNLESAVWIADCMAREIFHASGAFQSPQERAKPDERVVSPVFCSLAFPVIEKLSEVRTAAIAHHLIQTLVFLSRLEPRQAFLAVANIVVAGSGYEYESIGEAEVLDLVDLYLAERRSVILNDPECLSGLRQILETFVAAGSDRAIRRVQDLAELFA
jgi:hypothetical protein